MNCCLGCDARLQSGNMDGGMQSSCADSSQQGHRMSGPNTPLTPSSSADTGLPPRYPGNNNGNNNGSSNSNNAGNSQSGNGGPQTPHTPNPTNPFTVPSPSPAGNQGCQSSNSNSMVGPNTPLAPMEKARFPGPSPQGSGQMNQGPRTPVNSMDNSGSMPRTPSGVMDMMSASQQQQQQRYPGSSPQMSGGPASAGTPGFNQNSAGSMMTGQGPASFPSNSMSGAGPNMKMPSSPFPDLSSPRMTNSSMGLSDMGGGCNFPGTPSDNMPLNPVGTPNAMGPSPVSGPGKTTPFDPITSMAQMSQQLTSQVGPGPQLSSSPPMGMGGPNGGNGGMGPGPMGPGGPMGPMFNSSMHGMQGMPPMGDNLMSMGPGNGAGGPGGPGGGPGPQSVRNLIFPKKSG